MLKFLTHKLRTHSINENNFEKENDDHDSGTESDDEIDTSGVEMTGSGMDERVCSVSPADTDTGCSMESPAPDQQDAHSSEEELEVINSAQECGGGGGHLLVRSASAATSATLASSASCHLAVPEKRKWSQIGHENAENVPRYGNLHHLEHSSDEEVHNLLVQSMTTPVQFRTSPPLEALKPGGSWATVGSDYHHHHNHHHHQRLSSPPPAKLIHYDLSPRKRSRHTRHVHVPRPYLDFEKMQQARAVTAWKHSGDHSGELSVFCW